VSNTTKVLITKVLKTKFLSINAVLTIKKNQIKKSKKPINPELIKMYKK